MKTFKNNLGRIINLKSKVSNEKRIIDGTTKEDNNRLEYIIVESEPVRLPYLFVPTLVHVLEKPERLCKISLLFYRIVSYPPAYPNCDYIEYKYLFLKGCYDRYLLPSGQYEVVICEQLAYNFEVGDTIEVKLLLEPVGHDFVTIAKDNLYV